MCCPKRGFEQRRTKKHCLVVLSAESERGMGDLFIGVNAPTTARELRIVQFEGKDLCDHVSSLM
jgi:hypothetical protein